MHHGVARLGLLPRVARLGLLVHLGVAHLWLLAWLAALSSPLVASFGPAAGMPHPAWRQIGASLGLGCQCDVTVKGNSAASAKSATCSR